MNNNEVAAPDGAGLEAFEHIDQIMRQLHESLDQLGITPKLRQAFDRLPEADNCLAYIAQKTGEAANNVLDSVDAAKEEQAQLAAAARRAIASHSAEPQPTEAAQALLDLARRVEAGAARTDLILTDILLAQGFHDLTGQVIARVVTLGTELRISLVKLLGRTGSAEPVHGAAMRDLAGPAVPGFAAVDVLQEQADVDDLLASFGM